MTDKDRHRKVIDRVVKRRGSRRPADVVDRIRVADHAEAEALLARMKAEGYSKTPPLPGETRPPVAKRCVTATVPGFFVVMAEGLAERQGISPEEFYSAILTEGLYEAYMEFEAQKRELATALQRASERASGTE